MKIILLSLMITLGGCATAPKTVFVDRPVATPCLEGDIRLTRLPIESVSRADVQQWIEDGDYDRFRNILFSSFILLNSDVKVMRDLLEACR